MGHGRSDHIQERQTRRRTGAEYKDYFEFKEPIKHIPPHRVLAINRGEKENALQVKLEWDAATGHAIALERLPLPLPGEAPTLPLPPPRQAEEPPPPKRAEPTLLRPTRPRLRKCAKRKRHRLPKRPRPSRLRRPAAQPFRAVGRATEGSRSSPRRFPQEVHRRRPEPSACAESGGRNSP